jgi:outer membrane lipoprotein-sorting protein
MLVELVIVLALHADDKNEAEQLFRKMETKLTSAKSLECSHEAKIEGGKGPGSVKASLTLAEGNKSRLDVSGRFGDFEEKITLVSDGEKVVSLADRPGPKGPAPKWLNDAYRASLARAGLVVALTFIEGVGEQPKEFKADDEMKVSNFKLGKKEKVGDKEAQVVQYNVNIKEFSDPWEVSAWIDTKTNLLLKREVRIKKGDDRITNTETYSKISIDEKIDPKKFELPKD